MAKDPKKQQPENEQPESSGGADLPPWLRGDAPPPPPPKKTGKSSLPRLSPRKPGEEGDESVPPWLRGLDAPEQKTFTVGGTEVPKEFFDAAEEVPESVESHQSYDEWLAEQAESKREKSVEEEIPDIFAALGVEPEEPESEPEPEPKKPGTGSLMGGTGQLPDWFLGLEELDESEAPDWFKQMGTGALEEAEPPPPEPSKPDPIIDFFQGLGMEAESSETEEQDADLNLPGTAYFQQLVGKTPQPPASDEDDEELPDFGSVTGGGITGHFTGGMTGGGTRGHSSAPSFLDDEEDDDIFINRSVVGGTRRFDDEDDELLNPLAGAGTRRFDDANDEDFSEPVSRGTRLLHDLDDDMPVGGQTIRFDKGEDEPVGGATLPLNQIEDNAVGGQTIRFDKGGDDQPAGGQTVRFDDEEESLVPTDELNAFLEGIGESEASVTVPMSPAPVDIPQEELDAFLAGIEAPSLDPSALAGIEDPDLDLFVEAEPEAPPEVEEEVAPAPSPEEDLAWLSEIDSIVASATQASSTPNRQAVDHAAFEVSDTSEDEEAAPPMAQVGDHPFDFDERAAPPTQRSEPVPSDAALSGEALSGEALTDEGFDWSSIPEAPVEQTSADEGDSAWLNAIGTDDAHYEAKTTRIPTPEELGLSGMLNRGKKKDAPADEAAEQPSETPQLPAPGAKPQAKQQAKPAARRQEPPSPAPEEPAEEAFDLSSLYHQEEDKADAGWQIPADMAVNAPRDQSSDGEDDFAAMPGMMEDLEEWERVVRGNPEMAESEAAAAGDLDDLFANLTVDDIPEEELNSGWLTDDLLDEAASLDEILGSSATESAGELEQEFNLDNLPGFATADASSQMGQPESESGDDFFGMLERNSAANELPKTGSFSQPPPEAEEPAFSEAGGWDVPQSGAEDDSMFEVDTLDFGEIETAPPSGGADVPEPDDIDFGKWDMPEPTTESDSMFEVDTLDFGDADAASAAATALSGGVDVPEPEGIDFGKWDMPQPTTESDSMFEVDTLDFGEIDAASAASAATTAPTSGMDVPNLDEIDFGKWDVPQPTAESDSMFEVDTLDFEEIDAASAAAAASADVPEPDAVDFSKWNVPDPTAESDSLFEVDTLDFGDAGSDVPAGSAPAAPSAPSAAAPSDEFADWQSAQAEPQAAESEPIDFGSWELPDTDELFNTPETQTPESSFNLDDFSFEDEGESQRTEKSPEAAFNLDDFAFEDEESENPPTAQPSTPAFTFDDVSLDDVSLDDLTFEDAAEKMQPIQRGADPYATIDTRAAEEVAEDEVPPPPEFDAGQAEEAAADSFFESFGLGDESQPKRSELRGELFNEVDDIFASLDSEPPLSDEDTHPQPAAEVPASGIPASGIPSSGAPAAPKQPTAEPTDEEIADLFSTWDEESKADEESDSDMELFVDWGDNPEAAVSPDTSAEEPSDDSSEFELHTPPPMEIPETFTRKRQTETMKPIEMPKEGEDELDLFAQWGMEDSSPSPFTDVTGLDEGVDWASEFGKEEEDKQSAQDIRSFLESSGGLSDNTPAMPSKPSSTPAFEDIDSYLASLNPEQPEVSEQTDTIFDQPASLDIDALLDQPVSTERDKRRQGSIPPFDAGSASGLETTDADWLRQIGASVEDVSAGAMVRQKQDRPVEELPERLRKLRERGSKLPADQGEVSDDSLSAMIPTADLGLAPAPATTGGSMMDRTARITPEQQARIDRLQALAGAITEPKRMSAIEMTYDSPFMEDFQSDEENVVHAPTTTQETSTAARPAARRRLRLRVQIDRLLIVLLLAAAVTLPFVVPALRFGDPPPANFSGEPMAQAAFTAINSLGRNDLALVAVEYAPGSAGELDPVTDSMLRHILLRGATPVLVSGNPLALLRAETLIESFNDDEAFLNRINARQPLERNYEYFAARFLPGGVVGLRAFSADTAALLATDIRGQTTNLYINGLQDFALIALITDSAESYRGYAEQIAPYTRAPLVTAASYGAAPLIEPYMHGGSAAGLLVGYGDALTYSGLLDSVTAVRRGARVVPTPPPASSESSSGSPSSSIEITPEVTPEATAAGTGLIGIIGASGRVNMRAEPTTAASIVTGLDTGTRVSILGSSDDGAWANIRLADGREGWVNVQAAQLQIETPAPANKPRHHAGRVKQAVDVPATNTRPPTHAATAAPSNTPTATPTSTSTATETTERTPEGASLLSATAATPSESAQSAGESATPSPTPLPSDTPTPQPTDTPLPPTAIPPTEGPPPTAVPLVFSEGMQQERWYGINMGIIVSVVIISAGAIGNILRSLLRRGRRG